MILKKFKSTAISFLVSQQEIVSLFQKFCQLDRNSKGFISADEFLSVPEFAMNPLPQRLLKMVDGLNFKDFVAFLSAFSAKASLHHKIEFIFKLYDVDCNGKVSFNDIIEVLGDSKYCANCYKKQAIQETLS
ncbi:Calcineurin subunit B [Cucurbita argyrosperma subsp. argyrosperma]|nr:Calcineurin subunit B [Cucurbita argyrosperma subsp. argyrosperma]